jgi:hypothetical protein
MEPGKCESVGTSQSILIMINYMDTSLGLTRNGWPFLSGSRPEQAVEAACQRPRQHPPQPFRGALPAGRAQGQPALGAQSTPLGQVRTERAGSMGSPVRHHHRGQGCCEPHRHRSAQRGGPVRAPSPAHGGRSGVHRGGAVRLATSGRQAHDHQGGRPCPARTLREPPPLERCHYSYATGY